MVNLDFTKGKHGLIGISVNLAAQAQAQPPNIVIAFIETEI
jgi:hypothetical protein